MTARSLTLHQQTRIAINIIVEDDTGLLLFSILLVTKLCTWFYQVQRIVTVIKTALSTWVSDIKTALRFTGAVLTIIFVSLAYGFGVEL